MKNILVIRGGALGDFILTLPVFAALRQSFPGCRLEILGYPAIASLAVAGGLADGVSPIESARFNGFFVDGGSWPDEVGAWFSKFDCIISYLHDPEGVFRANVAGCSTATFIAGPHRPDESLGIHATQLLLQPLQGLGILKVNHRPRLVLQNPPKTGRILAAHPGSGSERKNWPEDRWSKLLKFVIDNTAHNVMLIGGEAEPERCARLAGKFPSTRVEVVQNLPLPELARRMQGCSAFIGHDSGITHLAAALDLPGVVLWGDTALATWQPKSDRMTILRHPRGIKALPVASVCSALKYLL